MSEFHDIFFFPLLDRLNRWNIIFTILGRKGYRLALLASQLKKIREPTLSARNAELRKPGAVIIRLARVRKSPGKNSRGDAEARKMFATARLETGR